MDIVRNVDVEVVIVLNKKSEIHLSVDSRKFHLRYYAAQLLDCCLSCGFGFVCGCGVFLCVCGGDFFLFFSPFVL